MMPRMEAVRQAQGMSVEDYLAEEERSQARHEYLGGAVYAMAGASDEHIALSMNLAFALRNHLQNTPCRVQMSDGKVRLRLAGEEVFYYPDVMVVCDPRDRICVKLSGAGFPGRFLAFPDQHQGILVFH